MPKIVIIGAGFGGLSCALRLSRVRDKRNFEIIVIDKKDTFDFLLSLPDIIGRGISPQALTCEIKPIAEKNGFEFISVLKTKSFENILVAGGGYTGIEAAANLRRFLFLNKKQARIIIVEKAKSILGPLPQWIKDYTGKNLLRLNIEVLTETSIERISDSTAYLSGQESFARALVIWAAGVTTAEFIRNLNAPKDIQGRLIVDEYLRINENSFSIGDAASVKYKDGYLRMAVKFAIAQGSLAAKNIARSIAGKKLIPYKPVDLGYIIPMANNRSCGKVFGVNLKGRFPTLLHFIMCLYRLSGAKNKVRFLSNLISSTTWTFPKI